MVSQIVGGLILLVAGALINRLLERRARLVVFYSHVGEFRLQPQGVVRTHSVVIRNSGRAFAQNVHVPHHGKLNAANIHFSIEPSSIGHTVQSLQNDTEEIFFPCLPAKFQVTVSYLYFPPLVVTQINAPIYSNEGLARVINVLPQQQWPTWVLGVTWVVLIFGAAIICYAFVEGLKWAMGYVR